MPEKESEMERETVNGQVEEKKQDDTFLEKRKKRKVGRLMIMKLNHITMNSSSSKEAEKERKNIEREDSGFFSS